MWYIIYQMFDHMQNILAIMYDMVMIKLLERSRVFLLCALERAKFVGI